MLRANYREKLVIHNVVGDCFFERSRLFPMESNFLLNMADHLIEIKTHCKKISVLRDSSSCDNISLIPPFFFPLLSCGAFRLIIDNRKYKLTIGRSWGADKKSRGCIEYQNNKTEYIYDIKYPKIGERFEFLRDDHLPKEDFILICAVCVWLKAINHSSSGDYA